MQPGKRTPAPPQGWMWLSLTSNRLVTPVHLRDKLWEHYQPICMPAHMLSTIQNSYENYEFVLVDGLKLARVKPARGVKQVIRTEGVRVTHMLYADDLSFTSNKADLMQCMRNRLLPYARRKGLTVNVAKSEVVHFDSQSNAQVSVFRFGTEQLVNTNSFRYL
eukprot:scaffold14325_cov20-Tisochrysis_lutea.AAC.1